MNMQKSRGFHHGIRKTVYRAQLSFFWADMRNDIELFLQGCTVCGATVRNKSNTTMVRCKIPERAWESVAVDLFDFKSKKYLLLMNDLSRFAEIRELTSTIAEKVIEAL